MFIQLIKGKNEQLDNISGYLKQNNISCQTVAGDEHKDAGT